MSRIWNFVGVRYIRNCITLYFDKQIPQAAAGLAYFLLLTVFPLIICVNAFLGLVNLDTAQIIFYLDGVMPQATLEILETYLYYISINESTGLLVAGLIMVCTTASAAFRAMMRVMASVYEEAPVRGIRGMIISILFPIGMLLTIYLSIGVIITGDWFLGWLVDVTGMTQFLTLWRNLRFLLLFLVFFLFVLMISHFASPKGTPRSPIIIGSAVSALALVAASGIFSWFIGFSTRYSLVYGSLVSIIVMMVWLYLCGNILLAGNVLSSVWYRNHGKGSKISQSVTEWKEEKKKP